MNTQRIQDFVMKGKEVFVGLEDSKKPGRSLFTASAPFAFHYSLPSYLIMFFIVKNIENLSSFFNAYIRHIYESLRP